MDALVLIVSEDEGLSSSRAALLKGCQVEIATPPQAVGILGQMSFNVVIFCQTISDEVAKPILKAARQRNPNVKSLALFCSGQERLLDSTLFEAGRNSPGVFIEAVSRLLPNQARAS